ncbi:MAG: putative selenate reductase subunit YgfK, partial [Pseudomonadota bacterium]
MTGEMHPLPVELLLSRMLGEWEQKKSFFDIPAELFFVPQENLCLNGQRFGQALETPLGVAAGPHTQLCSGILASWLVGARYLELKTVQTLDELQIPRPCIDMRDEGYNCEWSQELKLGQSFHEYLNAWILIHLLRHLLQHPQQQGTIFNMSVGYNMEGILQNNIQEFLGKMNDASLDGELEKALYKIHRAYPALDTIAIPKKLSDNVTLSTMHGCPPEEIEKIALYLIRERRLHTVVKLNPTLNGAKEVREILNQKCGFAINVPDSAFDHDLKYKDALKIIRNLRQAAQESGVSFGLKLTNTLESVNSDRLFPPDEIPMRYMSGRALHPLAINLAHKLQNEFNGELDISLSAGVDAFNVAEVLPLGLTPVTVCSDLLKPGGAGRLKQYVDNIRKEMQESGAQDLNHWATIKGDRLKNLASYRKKVLIDTNKRYHKEAHPWESIK